MHLDLGGDSYQVFFVEPDQVELVLKRARAAKLQAFTHEGLRAREDEA